MISAANVEPAYDLFPKLTADELMRLESPCVVHEHDGQTADGCRVHVYTIGGVLDGRIIVRPDGGGYKTHSGCIAIFDVDRGAADDMASALLEDMINALHAERRKLFEAEAARARMESAGHIGRMEAALKPDSDKSDAFVADAQAIRPLIGDDIVLTTGTKPQGRNERHRSEPRNRQDRLRPVGEGAPASRGSTDHGGSLPDQPRSDRTEAGG